MIPMKLSKPYVSVDTDDLTEYLTNLTSFDSRLITALQFQVLGSIKSRLDV